MNPKRYTGMFLSIFGILLLYAISFCYGEHIQGVIGINGIRFSDEIAEAARENDLHPALITAVIHAESNFDPQAISHVGAKGLMQITTPTQRYLRLNDVYNPYKNIHAGAKYLRELIDLFGGDLRLAIAAYNAGPGAVQRFNGIPPYSETRLYVKKVMAFFDQYRQAFVSSSLMS